MSSGPIGSRYDGKPLFVEDKRAGSRGGVTGADDITGMYPLLVAIVSIGVSVTVAAAAAVLVLIVAVIGITGDEEVLGSGGEDRFRLEGELRECDRAWLVVSGSDEDGSGAGCGAMRAKEEGGIRRRVDGF